MKGQGQLEETTRSAGSITRRALVAGAAAAPLALAGAPAEAQRCAGPPPEHVKGARVWLDLDQEELDWAYDQSVYAFNQKNIGERRDAANELARTLIAPPQRVAYGPTEIEKVDIYKTKRANAPTLIFIHGGSWRSGRSAQLVSMAEPYNNAGANFVAVDFNNIFESNGSLFPMVDQCRRAVAWVYKNASSFGGDASKVYLAGHSSGGHLAGCVVVTDWAKDFGLPVDVLKGALLGSGMYDLKAPRLSYRGNYVKFTDEMEDALSAQRHIDKLHTPLILTHGTLETPEFQRQTRDFHAAVRAAGKPAELLVGKGLNHFETQETMGNPYGFMGRATMGMLKLGMA